MFWNSICIGLLAFLSGATLAQQQTARPLDLGRDVRPLAHTPLPEEYIWTAGDATWQRTDRSQYPWREQMKRVDPHFFRRTFPLERVPAQATLYIAGPREADVFVNGRQVAHFASDIDAPIGFHVFHADAARLLHAGENVVAIRAIRGRGIVAGDATPATLQLTYGEVLAIKLLAAGPNREGASLLISDDKWRSSAQEQPHWSDAAFDDHAWLQVQLLGGVESDRDLMQWSADAGMYGWPGYRGMTAPLGNYVVLPEAVTHLYAGQAKFAHVDSLMSAKPAAPFAVDLPAQATALPDSESPALLVDFGREVAGRVLVTSASDADAVLSITYGESELEALATGLTPGQRGGNYLGTNLLEVPAHGEARGPKSAFRYVRVRLLRGGPHFAFTGITAEAIAYPVRYAGSFESSDPLLNRIWETGAYTAHLCMQDDLWDAPKRDRGRWAGDIDVEGRVISTVFGDKGLLERTLAALAPKGERAVNGIPGYSALWITSLASLYAHSGDLEYLRSQKPALLRVLAAMDASRDPHTGLFAPGKGQWPFIDWAPGLYSPAPAAAFGTDLQYLRGYAAAAMLLDRLGDAEQAAKVRSSEASLREAIARVPQSGPELFGPFWQINALAVETHLADTGENASKVWANVLAHVKQDSPDDPVISPYFNLSVLEAMAILGHRREALDWMRAYWGGMLAEGATSFWESYDLRWPKDNAHLSLQADGTSGYFVSLAHGWSSGPAAWLSENMLGIRAPQDGYRTVTIAPRLLGLEWAKGGVPTPQGVIVVSIARREDAVEIELTLPPGIAEAKIELEPGSALSVDGHSRAFAQSFPLSGTGKHMLLYKPEAR